MSIPSGVLSRLTRQGEPKQFTPEGVARVLCATLDNGYSADEICIALREKCSWDCGGDPDCNKKRKEIAEVALSAIQGNNQVLATADAVLQGLSIALRGLLLASRVIPVLRPIEIPLRLASISLSRVVSTIAPRRAANDAVREVVLRLAA